MESRITVHLAGEPVYDIVMETSFSQLLQELKTFDLKQRKVCIVTDSNVEQFYLREVSSLLEEACKSLHTFVFPAGEAFKTLDTVKDLYKSLIHFRFERKDLLVALGGGVVGDLCGYGAATFLRGVDFIQIPTTLLSQVDSSIGGKTGVDFDAYKNMVGAFHMPRLVYTNVQTLLTLPEEQFTSGMGEIIKHGLIKDDAYYQWIVGNKADILARNPLVCEEMIRKSDEIKRKVVEEDPKEQGERAILNFGHTLGHGIETRMDFQMCHGHCVGVGMLAAAAMSARRGYIPMEEVDQLRQTMIDFHMPVTVKGLSVEEIINITRSDKKMESGVMKFILLKKIGQACIDCQTTEEEMAEGLSYILE